MSEPARASSVPPSSRRVGSSVREEDVDSVRSSFIESFPPPSIVLKPRPEAIAATSPSVYRVLVACDLSDFAEGVLREAIGFAHGHMPSELHLMAVVEKAKEGFILHTEDRRRHVSREVVESLMNNLIWKVGVRKGSALEDVMKHIALHICVGEPAEAILALSREVMADLIVVGSREHQGLQRRLWGSVSKTVMTHADCSVVLSRPVDFVHGHRTPSIEPPKMWTTEPHHLTLHHYFTQAAGPKTMPHVL